MLTLYDYINVSANDITEENGDSTRKVRVRDVQTNTVTHPQTRIQAPAPFAGTVSKHQLHHFTSPRLCTLA